MDILLDTVHLCPYTEVSASCGWDHYSFQRSSKRFSPDDVSEVSVRSARHLALFLIGHCTAACLQLSWLPITTALYTLCQSHRLLQVMRVEAAISSLGSTMSTVECTDCMTNLIMGPWGPPSQPHVSATDDSSPTSKGLW